MWDLLGKDSINLEVLWSRKRKAKQYEGFLIISLKPNFGQPYITTSNFGKNMEDAFENILLQEADFQIRPSISDMYFETSQMLIRYEEQEVPCLRIICQDLLERRMSLQMRAE
jgi:hypothetical protein